jgi:hypothetical protein
LLVACYWMIEILNLSYLFLIPHFAILKLVFRLRRIRLGR